MSKRADFAWTERADGELEACVNGTMASATIARRLGTDAATVDQRIAERSLKRPRPTIERRAR
jgi:hypothetical protein